MQESKAGFEAHYSDLIQSRPIMWSLLTTARVITGSPSNILGVSLHPRGVLLVRGGGGGGVRTLRREALASGFSSDSTQSAQLLMPRQQSNTGSRRKPFRQVRGIHIGYSPQLYIPDCYMLAFEHIRRPAFHFVLVPSIQPGSLRLLVVSFHFGAVQLWAILDLFFYCDDVLVSLCALVYFQQQQHQQQPHHRQWDGLRGQGLI